MVVPAVAEAVAFADTSVLTPLVIDDVIVGDDDDASCDRTKTAKS